MRWCLLLSYPLLVHLAVVWSSALLDALALLALLLACLLPALRARQTWAWVGLGAGLAAIVLLTHFGAGDAALYLPATLIDAVLLWMFASSLAPSRTPLVTAIARVAWAGTLPAELLAYTRSVTALWSLTLAALLVATLLLAAFASRHAWSLFTNFIAFQIVIAVFALEYLYRRWRFRALAHPRLRDDLRIVVQLRPRPLA